MGSGISRTGSGSASYSRAGPHRAPRANMRRSISSVLICGSSSSTNEMEDYPAELLVNSAEHGCRKKLKFPRRNSDLSVGNGDNLISVKSESVVSSRRRLGAYEDPIVEVGSSHDDPSDRGKWLSESRELVPSHQCSDSSRCNGTASSSNGGRQSPLCVSESQLFLTDDMDGTNNIKGDTSRIGQRLNNPRSLYCNALGDSLLDEVSVDNNVSEEADYSSSGFGSSFVSDSPSHFHLSGEDSAQEVTTPDVGFLVSGSEQNRQVDNRLHGDMVSESITIPATSAEISSREVRRNSRRLFWDAFSRRSSRRRADLRTFSFSPARSDHLRSNRQVLDLGGGFNDDEFGGDLSSLGSRSPGSSDQQLQPRHEMWDNLSGTLSATDYPLPACPRGVHADGSCLCQSSSLAEESGPRTGISRIVMLAEALFEVLDQIHQQPMSLSLSVVSLPAPESVVDAFPVKTHGKSEKLLSSDDVSQCYICLAEYEEGDRIRTLPCHHEYHVTCVDKWLKEIHGVCPLCRGDVSLGSTEG